MSRLRSLLWLVLVIVGPAMLAAEGRYWVALQLRPDQDLAAVANQVASTARGRIESIDEGAGAFVLVTTDAAVGTIKTLPGVASVQTADDPYGAPRRPALAAPNGTTTWTTGTYAYDGSGNIKSIARPGQTDEFVYDAFGRLTSGTAGAGQKQEYTYDSFGNILTKKTNGTTVTYGIDAATNRVVLAGAQYDTAGRLTARPVGDSFTYDGLDVVTQSTVDSVSKVYLYNASDERVASFTIQNGLAAAVEWTIRSPEGKVLRRFSTAEDGALTWREDYIYRGAQLLASEVNGGEKRRFFHLDHLGTPRLITGNGGVQVSAHTYFPFGEEVTPAGTEALKFTGHERDAASLDYMHARYYATTWGRLLSVDPEMDLKKAMRNPQMWNRYSYVTNNPLNRIDPTGRAEASVVYRLVQYLYDGDKVIGFKTLGTLTREQAVAARQLGKSVQITAKTEKQAYRLANELESAAYPESANIHHARDAHVRNGNQAHVQSDGEAGHTYFRTFASQPIRNTIMLIGGLFIPLKVDIALTLTEYGLGKAAVYGNTKIPELRRTMAMGGEARGEGTADEIIEGHQ